MGSLSLVQLISRSNLIICHCVPVLGVWLQAQNLWLKPKHFLIGCLHNLHSCSDKTRASKERGLHLSSTCHPNDGTLQRGQNMLQPLYTTAPGVWTSRQETAVHSQNEGAYLYAHRDPGMWYPDYCVRGWAEQLQRPIQSLFPMVSLQKWLILLSKQSLQFWRPRSFLSH